MNWDYLHLVTHQFAVVLPIAGVAVGLAGWISGRESLERYGILSLLLAGAFAIPSYITGVAAADVVGQRTFVQPSIVQVHRTWATWASIGLVTSGIFAGFSLAQSGDRGLRRFVLVVGALAALLASLAAFQGGKIVHEREDPAAAVEPGTATAYHPMAPDQIASVPGGDS